VGLLRPPPRGALTRLCRWDQGLADALNWLEAYSDIPSGGALTWPPWRGQRLSVVLDNFKFKEILLPTICGHLEKDF